MRLIKYFSIAMLSLTFSNVLVADDYSPEWLKYIPNKGENTSVYYGPTKISDKTMEELTVYGPASVNNSTITKIASFKGPIEANHSSFNTIEINGIAKFDDVKISKELFINGPVFATNSTLEDVSIASEELSLSNTKVKKLLVRKNDHRSRKQRVYLEKGSVVDSLIFESNNGIVVFGDSTAKVKNLSGGEVESKK